tara:strand:+ start:176 stop:607 length:432 start_codon:yes stop_codon:yes gene_type:complete
MKFNNIINSKFKISYIFINIYFINLRKIRYLLFIPLLLIPNLEFDKVFIYNQILNITPNSLYSLENYKQYLEFGPLMINPNIIKTKVNSLIIQGYNYDKQPIYLAINCSSKAINVTNSRLEWKGWFLAEKGFEFDMIRFICKQ